MNQQQKQMQQEELTRERMAFLREQMERQIGLENQKQRVALLTLSVDLIKAAREDADAAKAIEWAKELEAYVLQLPAPVQS